MVITTWRKNLSSIFIPWFNCFLGNYNVFFWCLKYIYVYWDFNYLFKFYIQTITALPSKRCSITNYLVCVFTLVKHLTASFAVWQPRSIFWANSTLVSATYTKILMDPPITLSQIFSNAEKCSTPAKPLANHAHNGISSFSPIFSQWLVMNTDVKHKDRNNNSACELGASRGTDNNNIRDFSSTR